MHKYIFLASLLFLVPQYTHCPQPKSTKNAHPYLLYHQEPQHRSYSPVGINDPNAWTCENQILCVACMLALIEGVIVVSENHNKAK